MLATSHILGDACNVLRAKGAMSGAFERLPCGMELMTAFFATCFGLLFNCNASDHTCVHIFRDSNWYTLPLCSCSPPFILRAWHQCNSIFSLSAIQVLMRQHVLSAHRMQATRRTLLQKYAEVRMGRGARYRLGRFLLISFQILLDF